MPFNFLKMHKDKEDKLLCEHDITTDNEAKTTCRELAKIHGAEDPINAAKEFRKVYKYYLNYCSGNHSDIVDIVSRLTDFIFTPTRIKSYFALLECNEFTQVLLSKRIIPISGASKFSAIFDGLNEKEKKEELSRRCNLLHKNKGKSLTIKEVERLGKDILNDKESEFDIYKKQPIKQHSIEYSEPILLNELGKEYPLISGIIKNKGATENKNSEDKSNKLTEIRKEFTRMNKFTKIKLILYFTDLHKKGETFADADKKTSNLFGVLDSTIQKLRSLSASPEVLLDLLGKDHISEHIVYTITRTRDGAKHANNIKTIAQINKTNLLTTSSEEYYNKTNNEGILLKNVC